MPVTEIVGERVMDDTIDKEKPKIRLDKVREAGEQIWHKDPAKIEELTNEELNLAVHYTPQTVEPQKIVSLSRRIREFPGHVMGVIKEKLYTPVSSDYNPLDTGEPPSRKAA